MMMFRSKPHLLGLLAVLLLAVHPASPAPTNTNSSSTSPVPRPSSPRPTSQPSWHLLLALWRPKTSTTTEHPPIHTVTTPGSTLPLLSTPSTHHRISRPIVTASLTASEELQADEPATDDTGARPPRVTQDTEKRKSSARSHQANQNTSQQKPEAEGVTIDDSGPGKWMNLKVAARRVHDDAQFTSQSPVLTTASAYSQPPLTDNGERNEDPANAKVSNTSLTNPPEEMQYDSDEQTEDAGASHPAMTGMKIAKHESSDKKQSDTTSEEDLDLPDSPELDDHFFVHPFPHHRDVMNPEEEGQHTSINPTTEPHHFTTTTTVSSTEPHNTTTSPVASRTESDKFQTVKPERQQQGEGYIPSNESEGLQNMNETLSEVADTSESNNQTNEDKIPTSRSNKGQKVLEFQGPVVMEPLDEPSLVPLVGGSKEILTMKDDESAVLALLRVVQDSSKLESQFQGDTIMQGELGAIAENGGNPQHRANPEQPLAATIINSHRGVTSSPDDVPSSQRSNGARLVPPSLLVKKGFKNIDSRKSVNALDLRDKHGETVRDTSEAPEIPTTTTPIYEEISGTLKVDTSIDDVEDFDAHSRHTENTDEFLPPTNITHTNLIDISLHFPNGTLIPQPTTTPSVAAKSPPLSTPHPFSDYPSHYPPKISPSTSPQEPTTTTAAEGENWSSFIGNISSLANVSLSLNESILQRTLELSLEEHNKMVLQERGSLMLQLMDPSTDPCDDFYQFACGKWNGKFPIRQDKAVDNTFERLKEDLDDVLRSLLEEPPSDDDNNITKSVKILYAGCMNTDAIEALGAQPLLDLLKELGGWPVLEGDAWNDTGYDWVQQMARLRNYNNDILISEWVAADITNSSNHIIQLDQPELGLPGREYFINPGDYQYREAYLNLMVRVTQLLGAPLPSALTEMSDVLHFEKQVSRILTAAEERRNLSAVHRRMTMEELSEEVPEVDWSKYLEMIAWNNNQTEEVVVFGLDYFKKLVPLLKDTDNRTISNYLLWRFVKNRISNLGERYTTEKQDYIKVLFGRKSQPERWRSCVTYVSGNLGYVVGAMFVKRYFPEASKNDTDEMIGLIRESFRTALDEAFWMHTHTREVAQQKVDTIVKNVGYPEYLLNDTYMDEVYSELSFAPDTHFENVLKMLQFHARTNHNQLSVPVNRTAWVTSPAVVNAYYSRSKNMIVFPAGILQPPFYHPAFPRSLNYGGIGVVIGHEITHGFDDRGRQFDKNGNLQQWWKAEDVSKFYQRASCMLDQYGEYKVEEVGLKINPVNTLGENIADNAGIKIAYQAYKTWRKCHEEEVTVPYVNLTHDQLFFLNFGQIWCEVNSPEAMLTKLRSGQHSPNKFRVIGTLSNSEEFSAAFSCPVGSRMNPERKCRVW